MPKIPLRAQPRFPEVGPARMVNGYIAYYTKDKHTVYEHQLVAERKLGRKLHAGEIAHHLNEVRHDNRDENIEVKSSATHTREHNLERTPAARRSRPGTCQKCGASFVGAPERRYCSLRCSPRRTTPGRPTGPQLLQMLKTLSMADVARIFNVSHTAVRKWKRNAVP